MRCFRSSYIRPDYTGGIWKRNDHRPFWICVSGKSRDYRDVIVSKKAPFSKCFPSTLRPCPHQSVFKRKRNCFPRFQKDLRPHLSFSYRFRGPHYNAVSGLETLLYPRCACSKWTRRMRISIYRHAKLKPHGSVCPPFWIVTVEWSGARSCLFWWRHRFQTVSFSPSTLENSVFKKHRFQIAPLWRAFSNDSVFGGRFRCYSVDDSRIRSKTALFSFENGLVWTGPNTQSRRFQIPAL